MGETCGMAACSETCDSASRILSVNNETNIAIVVVLSILMLVDACVAAIAIYSAGHRQHESETVQPQCQSHPQLSAAAPSTASTSATNVFYANEKSNVSGVRVARGAASATGAMVFPGRL